MRLVGNHVRAKSVGHHALFTDGDGNERMQVIYEKVKQELMLKC